nr:transcription factor SPT20 homolog [Onthophagus taurus]
MLLILFAFLLISSSSANDEETNKLSSSTTNLDSNLRKALLKALTELEAESDGAGNPESTVEKAQASQVNIIQENVDKNFTVTSTKSPETQRQVVLIQKSAGIQSKPITTFFPSNLNVTENFLTSSTSFTTNYFKNKHQTTPKPINSFTIDDKLTTITSNKLDLTSPTPTVETPTTEESEAKVEDVQFFSAPLVAAFTVHQDEHGLPKSVEPIFKASTNTVPVVTNFIDDQRFYQQKQEELELQEKRRREDFLKQQQLKQEQFRNQFVIQEKQRALEEQLYKLQHQQRQQQEVLLKQQELIREQERVLREERERNRLKQNEQPFIPIIPNNRIENVEFTTSNPTKPSTVVFQSSVSFNPAEFSKGTSLPLNAQQLPVKNYNDFRQTPYYNQHQVQPNQFHQNQIQNIQSIQPIQQQIQPIQQQIQPIQQQIQPIQQQIQPIQQQIQPIQQIQPVQQQIQPIQQIQPVLTPPHYNTPTTVEIPPTQNVRIYRQEQETGTFPNNFVFNPNHHQQQQYVQIQPSIQVPNVRLLRSNEAFQNGPVQPPLVNHQLRNLLQQAGISKGRQEDLNIVSKVLSYNHFGGGGGNFFAVPARGYHFQVHRSDTKG